MNPIDELYQVAMDKKKIGQKVITLDYVIEQIQEARRESKKVVR